jgi:uncharacterized protein YrrD
VADTGTPIAWTALRRGHAVVDANGETIGKLSQVVADQQKDIFSGIVFRHGLLDRERFAPADTIASITSTEIALTLSGEEADRLEPYDS